jgi:hypothetical protein
MSLRLVVLDDDATPPNSSLFVTHEPQHNNRQGSPDGNRDPDRQARDAPLVYPHVSCPTFFHFTSSGVMLAPMHPVT